MPLRADWWKYGTPEEVADLEGQDFARAMRGAVFDTMTGRATEELGQAMLTAVRERRDDPQRKYISKQRRDERMARAYPPGLLVEPPPLPEPEPPPPPGPQQPVAAFQSPMVDLLSREDPETLAQVRERVDAQPGRWPGFEGALSELAARPPELTEEQRERVIRGSYELSLPGWLEPTFKAIEGELERPLTDQERQQIIGDAPLTPNRELQTAMIPLEILGVAFDGRRFVRHMVIHANVARDKQRDSPVYYDSDAGEFVKASQLSWAEMREREGDAFDQTFDSMPRAAQLVIEELSPGNVGIALFGGILARGLAAMTIPVATKMATLIRPLSSKTATATEFIGKAIPEFVRPFTRGSGALPREVAAGTAIRGAYEGSEPLVEGLPEPLRTGARVGIAAPAVLAGQPEVAARLAAAGGRAAQRGVEATAPALRRVVPAASLEPVGGAPLPEVSNVPIQSVQARPDLFQARDVPAGETTDPRRVEQIAGNFVPERFDPLLVARDPANPEAFIVMAGHHRLEAARQLGHETVPVRVFEGDITDPAVRARMQNEAVISNFNVAPQTVAEQYRALSVLRDNGLSVEQIARQTRLTAGTVDEVLDVGRLGADVLAQVAANETQLRPIASEVGRGARVYDIDTETAAGLFRRLAAEGEGATLPTRTAVRDTMDTFGRRLADQRVTQGRFEGMEGSAILDALAERTRLRTELAREAGRLSREINAAQRLAERTGTNIDDLVVGGRRVQDEIQARIDSIDTEVLKNLRARAEPAGPEPPAIAGGEATPHTQPPAAPAARALTAVEVDEISRLVDEVAIMPVNETRQARSDDAVRELQQRFGLSEDAIRELSGTLDDAEFARVFERIVPGARGQPLTTPSGEVSPVQAGMEGVALDQPRFRPEGETPAEQGALGIGPGEQPLETIGPLLPDEGPPPLRTPEQITLDRAGERVRLEGQQRGPLPPPRTDREIIADRARQAAEDRAATQPEVGLEGGGTEGIAPPLTDQPGLRRRGPAGPPPPAGRGRQPPFAEQLADVERAQDTGADMPDAPRRRWRGIVEQLDEAEIPERGPQGELPGTEFGPRGLEGPRYQFPTEPDPPTRTPRMLEAARAGGRRPPGPPKLPVPQPGRGSEDGALRILDEIIPGEDVGDELLRRFAGRMGEASQELKSELNKANRLLREVGIGRKDGDLWTVEGPTARIEGDRVIFDDPDGVLQGYRALHGLAQEPENLAAVVEHGRGWQAWEEADLLDFDPEALASVGDDVAPYFYRGMRVVELSEGVEAAAARTGGRALGARQPFQLPRVDANFDELIGRVWTRADGSRYRLEPLSWNYFEQASLRRVQGIRFRTASALLEELRVMELATPVRSAGEEAMLATQGKRVPRNVGPIFEGRRQLVRSADGEQRTITVGRYAIDDRLANTLENIMGEVRFTGRAAQTLRSWSFGFKQLKLLGSFFQQIDFATRMAAADTAGAIDDLIHLRVGSATMKTLKMPRDLIDIVTINVSAKRRGRLLEQILDADAPTWVRGREINARGIMREAWNTQDVSVVNRDIMDHLTRSVAEQQAAGTLAGRALAGARRNVRNLNTAFQRGLFDGVYLQAQYHALRNYIVPRLVRQHGDDWTDPQIMADAARQVNVMFSSLGEFQRVLRRDQTMRALGDMAIFSTVETESLFKQAFGLVGRNSELWSGYFLGVAVLLGTVANLVHRAATGEGLPLDRYNPVRRGGPLGIEYNSDFFAPNVPFLEGRGGLAVMLDTLGQLDTVIRILNPGSFFGARWNVLPRAGWNQAKGTDFYGRPIDSVGPKGIVSRAQQLVFDVGVGIGPGHVAGAIAELAGGAARALVPEGESRLGTAPRLVQAMGFNLRGMTTPDVLDLVARQSELVSHKTGEPARNADDLASGQMQEALEMFPEIQAELDRRTVTGSEREQAGSQARAARTEIDEGRIAAEGDFASAYRTGGMSLSQFREAIEDQQLSSAVRKRQVNADFERFQNTGDLPDDPFRAALVRWYDTWDLAKYAATGEAVNFDLRDELEAQLFAELSPEQIAYVEDRAALEHHPEAQWYFNNKKIIRDAGYWDTPAEVWVRVRDSLAGADVSVVLPPTFGEALQAAREAELSGDIGAATQWRAIFARVDRIADRAKLRIRQGDLALDRALVENYGLVPARGRGGGGTGLPTLPRTPALPALNPP